MRLDGKNIKPRSAKEASELIGKRICYLRSCDIDKSGRGYFFPRYAVITDYRSRHLVTESQDYIALSELVEVVEVTTKEQP